LNVDTTIVVLSAIYVINNSVVWCNCDSNGL